MQYYNTLVKIYNPTINKSMRIIRFEGLRRKAITLAEKVDAYNFRLQNAIRAAECGETIKKDKDRDYKKDSISRAKRKVKEIIRNNYSERLKMLTLTYKYLCEDQGKVLNDIKNMSSRFRDNMGYELRYIATLEWQKARKCLHVHMVVDCPFITADRWGSELWLQGFVKINTISYGKSKSQCLGAINYVLKYIEKDAVSSPYYSHFYYRSHNWNMEVEKDYRVTVDYDECITLARRYYQANDYHITRFDYQLWDNTWIQIIDVYAVE